MIKSKFLENVYFSPFNLEIKMVYGALYTGGIDTLIVRLANYLNNQGYTVSLYLNEGGDLQRTVDKNVKIIYYKSINELLNYSKYIYDEKKKYILILSFDSSSAAKAELLQIKLAKRSNAVHITGIFHPEWYFMRGQPFDRKFLNKRIANSIGNENIYYMNEECRTTHSKKWKINLEKSPIIPLPVNIRIPRVTVSKKNYLKIISVGRLINSKAYNLGAPKIVKECNDMGIEVYWDIYGYGPLENEIIELAEKLEVNNKFKMMGKLDYSDFDDVVLQYDLFIGHGTAVLESAILGVPSICAIIDQERLSYGYISQLPFGNVGELIDGQSTLDIRDMILSYAKLTEFDKITLIENQINYVSNYALPNFIKSLFNMARFSENFLEKLYRYVCAKIFYEYTEGWISINLLNKGYKRKIINLLK